MNYRKLGRTNCDISEIVFGCGGVGGGIFNHPFEQSVKMVATALDRGINWFDTAPSYGDTRSETNLGKILKELDTSPQVSTKVYLDPDQFDSIEDAVLTSIQKSLERLGMDKVTLFQLHNPITPNDCDDGKSIGVEKVLGDKGVMRAFEKAKERGFTDHTGFTAFGDTPCLKRVISEDFFDTAQVYYNMLNPSAGMGVGPAFYTADFENSIDDCRAQNMGVLAVRILSAGLLGGIALDQGAWRLGFAGVKDMARAQRIVESVLGMFDNDSTATVDAAIRFVLGNPGVSGALVGFKFEEHVLAAVESCGKGSLDPAIAAAVAELMG